MLKIWAEAIVNKKNNLFWIPLIKNHSHRLVVQYIQDLLRISLSHKLIKIKEKIARMLLLSLLVILKHKKTLGISLPLENKFLLRNSNSKLSQWIAMLIQAKATLQMISLLCDVGRIIIFYWKKIFKKLCIKKQYLSNMYQHIIKLILLFKTYFGNHFKLS